MPGRACRGLREEGLSGGTRLLRLTPQGPQDVVRDIQLSVQVPGGYSGGPLRAGGI